MDRVRFLLALCTRVLACLSACHRRGGGTADVENDRVCGIRLRAIWHPGASRGAERAALEEQGILSSLCDGNVREPQHCCRFLGQLLDLVLGPSCSDCIGRSGCQAAASARFAFIYRPSCHPCWGLSDMSRRHRHDRLSCRGSIDPVQPCLPRQSPSHATSVPIQALLAGSGSRRGCNPRGVPCDRRKCCRPG